MKLMTESELFRKNTILQKKLKVCQYLVFFESFFFILFARHDLSNNVYKLEGRGSG